MEGREFFQVTSITVYTCFYLPPCNTHHFLHLETLFLSKQWCTGIQAIFWEGFLQFFKWALEEMIAWTEGLHRNFFESQTSGCSFLSLNPLQLQLRKLERPVVLTIYLHNEKILAIQIPHLQRSQQHTVCVIKTYLLIVIEVPSVCHLTSPLRNSNPA